MFGEVAWIILSAEGFGEHATCEPRENLSVLDPALADNGGRSHPGEDRTGAAGSRPARCCLEREGHSAVDEARCCPDPKAALRRYGEEALLPSCADPLKPLSAAVLLRTTTRRSARRR